MLNVSSDDFKVGETGGVGHDINSSQNLSIRNEDIIHYKSESTNKLSHQSLNESSEDVSFDQLETD